MKKTFSIYPIIVMVFTLIIGTSCKKEEPAQLPVVATTPATNIAVSTATSGGTITDDGGATIIANGVCWGTNTNPSTSDSKTIDGIAVGQFVSNLSGLTGGTIYHVRAYATNSVGTGYGADVSFSTLGQLPVSLTQPASNISESAATLNGTVNANFLSTTVTFEYGTTSSYGHTVTVSQNPFTGNSITNVSVNITGLIAGSTYHFRIKAVNSIGTAYGDDISFTTSGNAPTAITQSACCLSTTGATLNGSVNANMLSTVVTFEYGLTTTYGNNVTATQSPLTGNLNSAVSAVISGLNPGTTYHFRIKAVNPLGTVYGNDMTFTTSGQLPTGLTLPATNLLTSGATLNGSVNPGYLTTTVTFEYGLTTSYGNTLTAVQSPLTGSSAVNVSAVLSGLTGGTTYHYRLKAVNSIGTFTGEDILFTTSGSAPTSNTQSATSISLTGAVLNGTVNANNLSTTVILEYGTTTSYGNTVTASQSPLTGNTSTNVSGSISGLTFGTIYHFRVKAVNSYGTTFGNDMTFRTLGSVPLCLTQPATNITTTGAVLNANVNANYLSTTIIFEYGTSTNYGNTVTATQSPLTGNINTNVSASISGLTAGVTYHYRVRATNALGTTYGSDLSFAYTIADVEGNIYRTVTIGTQVWMAENLKTTRYNDNISIPNVADQSSWDALTTPGYCWYNNDRGTYGEVYGAIYNRYSVLTGKLCPVGWRVPNNADWLVLINYLGGLDLAGGKMKTAGLTHWLSPNTGATNESGFSALPGGFRENGGFGQIGEHANFMSSENISTWVGAFSAHYNQLRADYGAGSLTVGLSVRCLKDN